jgi:tRNA U34 5-carboxymethylaminomethyl modifying GTPase MnmE/TrmE
MSSTSLDFLAGYRAEFPEAIAALDEWQRDAQARRARLSRAETPLSIGIMGQIKAGKSSFLNQILFQGQPLLPEAATPKTANLTRIRYSPTPRFTAYFYAPESWATLEQLAASDAQDLTARAARELVEQAHRAHGPEGIAALLRQGKMELHVDQTDALLDKLNDFVGAEGRYTPLVESSELALPLPQLQDYEIVDTPGMNDPVVSRTDKTRAYMAQCDVVFFLSPAERLLDETDQQLLAAQLPSKGVKRLVLVAAQFDAALIGEGYRFKSLADCEANTRQRLRNHAQRNLERLAAMREKQGYPEVAALLRATAQPIFASTYAQALATLPPERWNDSQRHVYEQFVELAEYDWHSAPPTPQDWQRISGFAELQAALDQARADKEQILATQRAQLERELTKRRTELLTHLRDQARERMAFLQTHDLADLDAHASKANQRLRAIADTLAAYVRGQSEKARAQAHSVKQDLQQLSRRARTLEERTGYETHRYSRRVSDAVWYKPWTWFSSHYEYYTETTTYYYLAVSDAIENLRNYLADSRRRLVAMFDELIAPQTISAGLRRELLAAMDTRSEDFNPQQLRALIESAIDRIAWPKLDIDESSLPVTISGFSGRELRSEHEMAALRTKLEQTVEALYKKLVEEIDQAVQQVCTELDTLAGQLQQALTHSLNDEIEQLRKAFAEKTKEIAHLQTLITAIEDNLLAVE